MIEICRPLPQGIGARHKGVSFFDSEMRSKEHRQHTSEKVPFLEPVPAVLRPVSAIFVVFNALDKFFLLRKGPRTAT